MRILQEWRLSCLASRISALEDSLSVVAGDSHPLLARRGSIDLTSHAARSGTKLAWMDHRMESGTLLMKDGGSESLIGPLAAEVRSSSIRLWSFLKCYSGSVLAGIIQDTFRYSSLTRFRTFSVQKARTSTWKHPISIFCIPTSSRQARTFLSKLNRVARTMLGAIWLIIYLHIERPYIWWTSFTSHWAGISSTCRLGIRIMSSSLGFILQTKQ